ncbi:hypothetical protein Acr_22g0001640 [Actinidia rufa]|uniref:Leucine-rich repeat-containing N-terminal plant-type domain-containing protein n=1 Tax=Actinidia rufa TaxID=165716 RepID=A0A7J0GIX9_9ERIC|nr:hypothetical protein Acr_22g0001640 [Actinidia rufa]
MLLLLFLLLLPFVSPAERCHPNDKNALLKFKESFLKPESLDPLQSWDPVFDCCGWALVECDETTNLVTGLTILSNVSGSIPDAIANLTHLDFLRFHKTPFLVGEIPPAIGKLSNLRYLEISWTSVSGHIPEFLANLKNLRFLLLSFNKLSGSIPPSLGTLPNLYALDLSRNQLTGSIPESFGHFPEEDSPITIILSHNKLSGEIPPSLASVDFSGVDLSRNNFSGDASMFFGTRKSTSMIVISRNNFKFNFSRVSFMESLVTLDISHNKIYGSIPSQITDAILLQELNVSYNRLCGEIPSGWKLKYRPEGFDNTSFLHNPSCLCGMPLGPCKP